MSALAGFGAALSLLATVWGPQSARSQSSPAPDVRVNINDDCIEGFFWPSQATVMVKVRSSGGAVVHSTTASVDSNGHFVEDDQGYPKGDCNRVPDLRPGMKVTASTGGTTKELILQSVTFDQLDPVTDTAAGTAPPGSVPEPYTYLQVYVYWNNENSSIETAPALSPIGAWSVDVGAMGGQVETESFGDVFVRDPDGDATVADHFVTAVSLGASVPAGAASGAGVAGTTVVPSGSLIRLSGRLSAAVRACVRRKRMKLLRVNGQQTRTVEAGRTGRRGRYSFTRRVRETTRFRVLYAGTKRCQSSKSRIKRVRVIRP
jgi:hypothetical protein